jgi:hypothetical protein
MLYAEKEYFFISIFLSDDALRHSALGHHKKNGLPKQPNTLVTGQTCQLTHGGSWTVLREQPATLARDEAIVADEAVGDGILEGVGLLGAARQIDTAVAVPARQQAGNRLFAFRHLNLLL